MRTAYGCDPQKSHPREIGWCRPNPGGLSPISEIHVTRARSRTAPSSRERSAKAVGLVPGAPGEAAAGKMMRRASHWLRCTGWWTGDVSSRSSSGHTDPDGVEKGSASFGVEIAVARAYALSRGGARADRRVTNLRLNFGSELIPDLP
jgi:hypothetical protein